ncbi:MAG: hypothetical protein ACRDJV_12965 [Actinomycetota bacterium]
MTGLTPSFLAHGVGSVYESPIPVGAYLAGAAGTVLASFGIRILSTTRPEAGRRYQVAGRRTARWLTYVLRGLGVVGLALTLASGVIVRGEGGPLVPLLFWVGLVVGVTIASALVAGTWAAVDPWGTIESGYRIDEQHGRSRTPPWWLGPVLLYGLFWFELVSESGFEDVGIVFVLVLYSVFAFGLRSMLGEHWRTTDPLSILFGFAERTAPFELEHDGIYARSPLTSLDQPHPLQAGLTASVFVLLASTTLDNVRETVGWSSFLTDIGVADFSATIVDSLALIVFTGLFAAPFVAAIALARVWLPKSRSLGETVRLFAWSLIPIGIAYLLAHNAPLFISGIPQVIRGLADPFGFGWNLLGAGALFEGYVPSPRFVWFVEIGIIVGGHILGVLTAHRTALRASESPQRAVRSQYPLMALMTIYTVATLWLLSQPLVT